MRFVSYTQKPLHYQHSLSIQKIYKINSLEILRLKENIKEKVCILREKSRMKQKYDGTEFGRQNLKFLYAAVKMVQENRPPEL